MMMCKEQKSAIVFQRLPSSVLRRYALSSGFQVGKQICGRDRLKFGIQGLFESVMFRRKGTINRDRITFDTAGEAFRSKRMLRCEEMQNPYRIFAGKQPHGIDRAS